jgi:alginate O-acetyltransferase complex protein AlgI
LLFASLIFYSWGELAFVFVMITSIIINFFSALLIEKGFRKTGIIISVIVSLLFLFYFKYANFAYDNFYELIRILHLSNKDIINLPRIALPIGISFYTFQILSYTIDVYRGRVKPTRNLIHFATYVTMFPQLIAGPIVRYIDIQKQLVSRTISLNKFTDGIERFIIGLVKKVIIANTFAIVTDEIFSFDLSQISAASAWIAVTAYTFQIYFDFSGYSDMAIGMGKMLGFDFQENFNYPYIAKSIKEFWRRWHISLSTWFRDYLYIPLGGNRVSKSRLYFNLIFVFFITGLWHGASWNFIIWGSFHGFFLLIERSPWGKILDKIWSPVAHIYTLLVVMTGWVFFRAGNLHDAIGFLKTMFGAGSGEAAYHISKYFNMELCLVLLLAVLFSTPVYHKFLLYFGNIKRRYDFSTGILKALYFFILFISFILVSAYLSAGTYNPFIYFRF